MRSRVVRGFYMEKRVIKSLAYPRGLTVGVVDGWVGLMKFLFPVFALFLFCKLCVAEEDFRTWTSSDGRKIQAKFIEKVGSSSVKIENATGKEFTLPKSSISAADWKYVEDVVAVQDARNAKNLFNLPEPFDDKGEGGIIIASKKGVVRVFQNIGNNKKDEPDTYEKPEDSSQYSDSLKVKQVTRDVIVGESIPVGSTIITGEDSEADLILTNGSLAKLRADSKLVLNTFWQKNFEPSAKKVTQLEEEVSSSRIALKLEIGDLVVDVKKLNKDSSFMVESPLGVAGIRGTQFGMSVDSKSTELAVLEGKVGFKDANQQIENVETAQKVVGAEGGASDVDALPDDKKNELAKAVADSKKVASKYDLTRLANTVEGYASKPNYIVKSALDLELIWCPPGSFNMGEGGDAQQVILTKGFYLGKYEVTQEQYEKVMGNNPSSFKGENLPVEQVTWDDAVAFCKALTRQEAIPRGWEFTLPTEAQWEYACRAGTTTKYSWGDDLDPKLANYKDSGLKKTGAVGSYRPNAWGFYDMHGNVSEWCADRSRSRRTGRSYYPLTDPIGGSSISKFNLRGGNWYTDGTEIRSAHWYITPPSSRFRNIGFRVGFQSSK
ncbi:SUMF1/EgtB/PvdO family nonheme iron enzyme [Opitutales bacterium]|nr:SUMF1/EgtB/PvdO family nonheme iron enzyme [Opitutales bacterium]